MEEAAVFVLRTLVPLWLAILGNSYCFLSGNRTSGSNVTEKTMSKVVWNQTVIGMSIVDDIKTFSDHGLEAIDSVAKNIISLKLSVMYLYGQCCEICKINMHV